ncbi:hypothetical protein, conserved [Eimeria necatrix]|uniref:YqgF/RNase H-like domain-containing protein n=1 Tax=Eimeria necatrix TaxID=51315 RepID=U6MR83_9EIME|nr:hypothetical protein, conserved [Eimeria necatrix]CDJ65583.1 hypothetical protein, conserved [Eimeria necatrix]
MTAGKCPLPQFKLDRSIAATASAKTAQVSTTGAAQQRSSCGEDRVTLVEWFRPNDGSQQNEEQQQQQQQLQHAQQLVYQQNVTAPKQQRQERQQQQGWRKQQQQVRGLDSSEIRSLLLQCKSILSFDLGSQKTGVAIAERSLHSRHLLAAATSAQQQLQQQQHSLLQHEAAAAQEPLLWPADYSGLYSIVSLMLLPHERSFASLLPLLLQQQQQQQADLLLLGLPLNPCLPLHLRFQTPRVKRHLSVARELQRRLRAAAAQEGAAAAAAVPVLLVDESYSTWKARKRYKCEKRKGPPRSRLDSAAACEMLQGLLAAAASTAGPTGVLQLRAPREFTRQKQNDPLLQMEAPESRELST